jgi:D-glycero-D-manno-heptose 1,7-bisphosphate phosphatase
MHPAIFLDRDGVIIDNVASYVRTWEDVSILPGALSALARLRDSGFKVVIVTNQSAVGRGIISIEVARSINDRLLQIIHQAGGQIDGVFMCVHAPQQGCDCRKPRPGLIMQAASELSLDLSRSFLIGDALSDIQSGQNAGIPVNIMVRTGRGEQQSHLPDAHTLKPFLIYDRLEDAVKEIFDNLLSQ